MEQLSPTDARNVFCRFYNEIEQQEELLPDKIKRAFPYMKAQNLLIQYRSIAGLETILGQMERRTKFESNLSASVKNLEPHYPVFKNDFEVFLNRYKYLYLQELIET